MFEECPYINLQVIKLSVYFKMPPESCGNRGIKIDPKRIALFEVKLRSRDKVIHIPCKTYIHMFH